jgi:hypothetical protein
MLERYFEMGKKKSSNQKASNLTPTQLRWLNGEWLLGVADAGASSSETMQALSLIANIGGKSEALWLAHGDESKFFWRKGLNQPITREELEDHKSRWLTPDNDEYGGESFFIHHYYSDTEKQTLWNEHGDKELYHFECCLRRPIPIGASVDAAMVAFSGDGLKPFKIEGETGKPLPKTIPAARREMHSTLFVNDAGEVTGFGRPNG